jgi:mannose-6-phosphate isomerase-like protein (cupin superfamily)
VWSIKGNGEALHDLTCAPDLAGHPATAAKHCQLVLESRKPWEESGADAHPLEQFFRVEERTGEAILDGVWTGIKPGFAVFVPAGANHNIVNTGNTPLNLYTIYAPPNHRDGVVHPTRDAAEADNEHFAGQTKSGQAS